MSHSRPFEVGVWDEFTGEQARTLTVEHNDPYTGWIHRALSKPGARVIRAANSPLMYRKVLQ